MIGIDLKFCAFRAGIHEEVDDVGRLSPFLAILLITTAASRGTRIYSLGRGSYSFALNFFDRELVLHLVAVQR